MSGPTRKIIVPTRGRDGLIVQPSDVSPEREVVENHNRDRFAAHFNFADPITGNVRTYDSEGRYNCGRCNMADGKKCLLVEIPEIDLEAGSCEDWEIQCAGDPEYRLQEKDDELASYAVAENGHTWGCGVCPFASKAKKPDSQGRTLYCGKGDFRTFPTACCSINGAPTVDDGDDDEDDEYDDKPKWAHLAKMARKK